MRDQHLEITGSGEHADPIGRILSSATGSIQPISDVLVMSDLPEDAVRWKHSGHHVLVLSNRSSQLDGGRLGTRPPAGHLHLLPPDWYPLIWLRSRGDDELISRALTSLRPDGRAVVVSGRTTNFAGSKPGLALLSITPAGNGLDYLHVYEKTASTLAEIEPGCHFCVPVRHTLNAEAGLPGATSILWGDRDFFVMPDLAPIVEGHLLIVTSEHHLSMANAPVSVRSRLHAQITKVRRVFRNAFNSDAVFLEHGAMFPHDAGSCIDHAHWHCFPATAARYSIIDKLISAGYDGFDIDLSYLRQARTSRESYLLVREDRRTRFFPVRDAQCQFLRFHMAEVTTGGQWLWHQMFDTPRSRDLFADSLSRLAKVAHL